MYIILCTIIANLIADASPVFTFTFTHNNTTYTYSAYHNSNGDTDIFLETSEGYSDFWWECGNYTVPDEARIAKMCKFHIEEIMAA